MLLASNNFVECSTPLRNSIMQFWMLDDNTKKVFHTSGLRVDLCMDNQERKSGWDGGWDASMKRWFTEHTLFFYI